MTSAGNEAPIKNADFKLELDDQVEQTAFSGGGRRRLLATTSQFPSLSTLKQVTQNFIKAKSFLERNELIPVGTVNFWYFNKMCRIMKWLGRTKTSSYISGELATLLIDSMDCDTGEATGKVQGGSQDGMKGVINCSGKKCHAYKLVKHLLNPPSPSAPTCPSGRKLLSHNDPTYWGGEAGDGYQAAARVCYARVDGMQFVEGLEGWTGAADFEKACNNEVCKTTSYYEYGQQKYYCDPNAKAVTEGSCEGFGTVEDCEDVFKDKTCTDGASADGYLYQCEWTGVATGSLCRQKKTQCTAGAECFPSAATVRTPDGVKRIDDVRLGDRVLAVSSEDGTLSYEPVYLFSHADAHASARFVTVTVSVDDASNATLVATPGHRVPVASPKSNGAFAGHLLKTAAEISPGDMVWIASATGADLVPRVVVAVEIDAAPRAGAGLFTLHASSRYTVVVDGVAASEVAMPLAAAAPFLKVAKMAHAVMPTCEHYTTVAKAAVGLFAVRSLNPLARHGGDPSKLAFPCA